MGDICNSHKSDLRVLLLIYFHLDKVIWKETDLSEVMTEVACSTKLHKNKKGIHLLLLASPQNNNFVTHNTKCFSAILACTNLVTCFFTGIADKADG